VSETRILDSFAVLTLLGGEPGGEEVADLLRQAQEDNMRLLMTWVNMGEVAYLIERRWGEGRLNQVLATLEETAMEIVPVGRDLALATSHIKARHPLAYADAFAAALAVETEAKLVTGNPEFELLEGLLHIQWLPGGQQQAGV
jgi:predicted nucleic acid-binding protein